MSVLSQAIELDPALLEQSAALLHSFDWQGVAMVEYKIDARTGKTYLMEINGRMWGSIQLAIDAGVDFPLLLLRAAMNEPALPRKDYRPGSRLRWEWGDVDNLITTIRHNGGPSANRASALGRFVASFRPGIRAEILRLSDPAPFARETLDWWRSTLS